MNRLKDYGFKKKWLPYGFSIEWESGEGSDLDQMKLEEWLRGGKHNDEFLIVRWDPELRRYVENRTSRFSPEELKNIKADDTKPRPFKMVKTGKEKTISNSDSRIYYWAHMLDECGA